MPEENSTPAATEPRFPDLSRADDLAHPINRLSGIVNYSNTLMRCYAESARELWREQDYAGMQWEGERRNNPSVLACDSPTQRKRAEHVAIYEKTCEEWHGDLNDLSEAVRLAMPDVLLSCKFLPPPQCIHRDRKTDWDAFALEMKRVWIEAKRLMDVALAPALSAEVTPGLGEADLLRACGFPESCSAESVEWLRVAARLLDRGAHHSRELAAAAVAITAAGTVIEPARDRDNPRPWESTPAPAKVGPLTVQCPWFGNDAPRVAVNGWAKRARVTEVLTQLGGMIRGGSFDAIQSAIAVDRAISEHWLRMERYDAWEPGMRSGSGWTDIVSVLPLGSQRAKELANAKASTPHRSTTAANIATANAETVSPAIDAADDAAVAMAKDDTAPTNGNGRRGRLTRAESEAKHAQLLATIRQHPTLMDDPGTLANNIDVSESTVRRWIAAEKETYLSSRAANASRDDDD